jgi:hypothetical protein
MMSTVPRLRFISNRGAAGQDDDEAGEIQFESYNDAGTPEKIQYARIKAKIKDATDGAEGGQLTLQVASHNGSMTNGLKLVDGDASGEVDVEIGGGAASVTTVQGLLKIKDDTTLVFGNDDNATFEYDENGTDRLLYAGAGLRISDDVKLEFGTGGDATIEYDEDGNDVLLINGAATKFTVDGVEIENSNSGSGPALLIDNDNVDANALDIDAANTTANVLDIAAPDLTSGIALSIDATGGNCVEAMKISHTVTTTTANTSFPGYAALHIDSARASNTTNAAHMTGIAIDMDETNANGGDNIMRGMWITPTLAHDTAAGNPIVKGIEITAQGGLPGNTVARGMEINCIDADYNQGIWITVDHSNSGFHHIKCISGEDSSDFFQVQTGVEGATQLRTNDSDGTNADLTFDIDGDITSNTKAEGHIVQNTSTATAAGAGGVASGGYVTTRHSKVNGLYTTTIELDITGLKSPSADQEIIGEDGAGAAYLTKIETTKTGRIYRIEMICIEAPTTGELDIDLIASDSNSLAYDSAEGTNVDLVIATGNWTIGLMKDNMTIGGTDLNNKYVYLSTGTSSGATSGVYDAGKYLIVMYGA